jgi:hypothetical protein
MQALRSTVGLVAVLSVLLVLFAVATKHVMDANLEDGRIMTKITVSGME